MPHTFLCVLCVVETYREQHSVSCAVTTYSMYRKQPFASVPFPPKIPLPFAFRANMIQMPVFVYFWEEIRKNIRNDEIKKSI